MKGKLQKDNQKFQTNFKIHLAIINQKENLYR
jgi:hypothetical protein